jgi:hypothetical protein
MAEFVGKEEDNGSERMKDEEKKENVDEKEEEEERDDIGLTSTNITKDISSYLQSSPHDDQEDSSDDEGVQQKEEEKCQQQLESEEEEDHRFAAYELVDDDYILQEQEEGNEDEEFGEFKEASSATNGGHANQVEDESYLRNGSQESQSSSDYRVPPFSVNRSSIPPLTAGMVVLQIYLSLSFTILSIEKIDSIKRAMQSLSITPRPAAGKIVTPSLPLISLPLSERIVSAVIAARPRLGDETCFQPQGIVLEDTESFQSSSANPDPPTADFADFGDHFQNSPHDELPQEES